MRALYVEWLQRGREPDTFWRCTFGEVMVMLRAYEFHDELQWMHTSAVMSMYANIHRQKNARAYEWGDFNPYAQVKKKTTAVKPITPKHDHLFAQMAAKLNNNGE
jgi:hypothetical protein